MSLDNLIKITTTQNNKSQTICKEFPKEEPAYSKEKLIRQQYLNILAQSYVLCDFQKVEISCGEYKIKIVKTKWKE